MRPKSLHVVVQQVVGAENCSGCGACCLLDPGLSMSLDEQGYLRPVLDSASSDPRGDAVAVFESICPGRKVTAPRPLGSARHPTMGSVVSAWRAWSADPEERYVGSSGGVLTALSRWLIDSGEAVRVVGARADPRSPSTTVPVTISRREDVISAAGSRYAPVATAGHPDVRRTGSAVVAKPCEVSALRAMDATEGSSSPPIYLSFFCAGTPSQLATTNLLDGMGVRETGEIKSLHYRGRGWPGRFTVVTGKGTWSSSYENSWGSHLGPTIQWRCKMCADGVGESADVVAADLWRSDDRGYPVFDEEDGVSAVIARTQRGHDVLTRARAAGVIVAQPIDVEALADSQPFQRKRRETMVGRLVGARLAARPVPRYRGFGVLALALRSPRNLVRTARATYLRVRSGRTTAPAPGAEGLS